MPRGRPKKRLSRMDAAVDAMLPYGFPETRVVKILKELLKAYGGDEGWPFIEDCSYKELLDALLRDEETDDQVAQGGEQNEDQSGADEEPASTSNGAADSYQEPEANSRLDIAPVAEPTCTETGQTLSTIRNAEAERIGWKDILPDKTIPVTANPVSENGQKSLKKVGSTITCEIPALPYKDNIPSLPLKCGKRMPCYGWIEDNEDGNDNDFVTLEPGPLVLREKASLVAGEMSAPPSGARRLRKSKWDQKPYNT